MIVRIIHLGPACTVYPSNLFLANGCALVGRTPDCQLIIDDLSVSRKHAEIVRHNDQVTLNDLESTNGTYVNMKRIRTCELHNAMRLQFGKIGFLVTITDTPPGRWGSDIDTGEWEIESLAE